MLDECGFKLWLLYGLLNCNYQRLSRDILSIDNRGFVHTPGRFSQFICNGYTMVDVRLVPGILLLIHT